MAGRRDAVRNRALLVGAAEHVFREHGATAPLDLVAGRAGVGRGTLYRHFSGRGELVAAVYAMRMDALEAYGRTVPPERALDHLVVEIAELQLDAPGMHTLMRREPDGPTLLAEVERRIRVLLSWALAAAGDRVRPDVDVEDVLLTFGMVDGVIAGEPADRMAPAVRRAVTLVLRGLLVPGAATDPLPEPRLTLPL